MAPKISVFEEIRRRKEMPYVMGMYNTMREQNMDISAVSMFKALKDAFIPTDGNDYIIKGKDDVVQLIHTFLIDMDTIKATSSFLDPISTKIENITTEIKELSAIIDWKEIKIIKLTRTCTKADRDDIEISVNKIREQIFELKISIYGLRLEMFEYIRYRDIDKIIHDTEWERLLLYNTHNLANKIMEAFKLRISIVV